MARRASRTFAESASRFNGFGAFKHNHKRGQPWLCGLEQPRANRIGNSRCAAGFCKQTRARASRRRCQRSLLGKAATSIPRVPLEGPSDIWYCEAGTVRNMAAFGGMEGVHTCRRRSTARQAARMLGCTDARPRMHSDRSPCCARKRTPAGPRAPEETSAASSGTTVAGLYAATPAEPPGAGRAPPRWLSILEVSMPIWSGKCSTVRSARRASSTPLSCIQRQQARPDCSRPAPTTGDWPGEAYGGASGPHAKRAGSSSAGPSSATRGSSKTSAATRARLMARSAGARVAPWAAASRGRSAPAAPLPASAAPLPPRATHTLSRASSRLATSTLAQAVSCGASTCTTEGGHTAV
mmetsp:Transcript_24556/g.61833  ORF Transcript_24556/g.61833 Transcript_24556/m.61833 type:complete len:353 (-) Transcript_24556:92-1150(-)